jgi:hypothetical protein
MLMDGALAVLGRVSNLDALSSPLASCCRFAEQIEEGPAALSVFHPKTQESVATAEPVTFSSDESSGFVFETIGDAPVEEVPASAHTEHAISSDRLVLEVRDDHVFAKLLVDDEPSKAWPGVRRTLRGMLDVDVELLESAAPHLCFAVRPADLGGPVLSLPEVSREVQRVLQSQASRTQADVTSSTPAMTAAAPPSRPTTNPSNESQVVFSLPKEGPLKPGDFDDARLSEPDSSSALVDVVGQVLSILLSVEYHRALQLMGASPLVIAHGVAYARAETLKRVVESAGGKIQLTEPGRYPAS